ncbi:MAG: glycoside hydrolase family 31 [Microbacteriaceae bacterium]|nr:glycoside hydrolase family 31 [Microbacteriaceae bacterium]
MIPVFRRFAHLRERLVPYLVEQARRSVETSAPLMRPLYFDFPDDEKVWDYPLQWMLGDEILVAPVTEAGASEWSTYLPEGEWVDAWTGSPIEGGQLVARAVPIDEIPIYVRSSAWDRLAEIFLP